MKNITIEQLQIFRNEYLKNEKARVVKNALVKNDLETISRQFEAEAQNPFVFSIDLKTMPVTNQLRSGRCWIFSATNVLREMIGHSCKIKDFELSQNYLAFYDKLEKVNWFMNCALKEIDKPLDSEVMRFLLQNAVSDGGQWNMIQSLAKKYGVCPKSAMPETYMSSHTMSMNKIINRRLRKFVADCKKEGASSYEALRVEALQELYNLIVSCFGLPPEQFTFEYKDKDDTYHVDYALTPLAFYDKYLKVDLEDYVGVIHAPTSDKPYHQLFTVKYLGNVVDGHRIEMLNVPMEEFKEATLKQLKDGHPVWFGCDCGKDGDRQQGLWDDQLFDYENTFDIKLSMSKAEMLDTHESAMNHAMVFTGVNLDENGQPNRWKIENSWGDQIAHKGYFIASDTWFEKYMYVVAINKKYLSEKALKALERQPIELAPWDPFGTLATN